MVDQPTSNTGIILDEGGGELEVSPSAIAKIWGSLTEMGGAIATTIAGLSTAAFKRTGNLSVQVSAAGLGNAADTTDDVLMTYQLAAGAFDVASRQLTILAAGTFAANSHNKQVKLWIGADAQTVGSAIVTTNTHAICATGVVTTSGGGWEAGVQVTKYGAAASNTQQAAAAQSACGTTHNGTQAPTALTLTESAAMYVTVTGASGTTGAASDVLGMLLDLSWAQ